MRATLVFNPRHDLEFEAIAAGLLEGATSTSHLQGQLRANYPGAVVHARELSGEAGLVWYVYRDGRWMGSDGA